jgi:hypothetical protein
MNRKYQQFKPVYDEIRGDIGDLCLHTSTSFPFNLDNYMTKSQNIVN